MVCPGKMRDPHRFRILNSVELLCGLTLWVVSGIARGEWPHDKGAELMANWLRSILPREEKFFPLFEAHGEQIERGATQLQSLLAQPSHAPSFDQLERTVNDGSKISAQVLDRLRASFVVPFDRADIKEMTVTMQAALKAMMGAATARHAPKLNATADTLPPFGDLIAQAAKDLRTAMPLLEKVDRNTDELHAIRERIADANARTIAQRDTAMMHLFERSGDRIETLAGVRLLDRIALVVDRLDAAADRIDDLVLDYV